MENFKELFDQMLGWVTNDMAKGLFVDAYNKIEREKKLANKDESQLQQAVVGSSEADVCGKPCDELRTACNECKDKFYEWNAKQSQTDH